WAKEFHKDRASSIKVLLRENTDLVRSNQRISLTAPSKALKLKGWQLMNSL
ncbi:hypothetical protein Tco_0544686, partial [Tanacetum coccineum]